MKFFGKILKETAVLFNFLYFGVITEYLVENFARVLQCTRPERLEINKHCSLLDPFLNYKENKVL